MTKAHSCVLVALLISFSLGAWAQPGRHLGDHAGPAALDSPAWRDLMAEPVLQDETLAHHAAGVARAWGHASAADQLRRSLLTLHGRALAGQALPARLGNLLGQTPPDDGVIQAAWDAGLNRAWAEVEWDAQPPPEGLPAGARAVAQRPGFWRLPNDQLAVQPVLRNGASVILALPGPPRLTLQAAGRAVQMSCRGRTANLRWASGEIARFLCTSPSPVPADVWAALTPSVPQWSMTVPIEEGALDLWVSNLAGRPPWSLVLLIERNAHCRDQKNCLQGKLPTTEELAQTRREGQARALEVHARESRERESRERDRALDHKRLILWAAAAAATVVGFGVYFVAARIVGTTAVSGLIVLVSLAIGVWFFSQIRSEEGWGKLGYLIFSVGALVLGTILAMLYAKVYRFLESR
jgi:hypothetical protein